MAKNQTVWGIDIGNTSLKALRCTLATESGKVEALACDFIEHSKVLSQPGTDAAEVLAETLQTFLSRNSTKGDRIAISVSGQNTISRFLPLPPVDPKKIPDVIRYEAKQWLPFDLNDVVFDFQPLGAPVHDDSEGALVDATIGMFAIKRDIAAKALAPYTSRSVDIDSIQSSPIALFNFMEFDQLLSPAADDADKADEDSAQESLIALCIGTDATDVVITNGEKIWIRSIPLGGNSFTKALTRELQLTFSKAEYLKRNINTSKDVDEQKRVITAMRPVFNDMVNEVNRSLEYYQTLNRKAKFQKIIALGNASKLPGLRQFIAQNLGYEVVRLNRFNNLVGNEIVETQLFKDNVHSFAVCYGLAIQQLGIASLKTNLIPREVIRDRIIREKKPWMLVAAASLLLGITIQFVGAVSAFHSVSKEEYENAGKKAKEVMQFASGLKTKTKTAVDDFDRVDKLGSNLTKNVEGRITWLELLRAINAALPQSQEGAIGPPVNQAGQRLPFTSENFAEVDQVFVESIEAITVSGLSDWFAPLKERYYPDDDELWEASTASGSGTGGTTGKSGTTSSTAGKGGTTGTVAVTEAVSTAGTDESSDDGKAHDTSKPFPRNKYSSKELLEMIKGPGGSSSGGSSSSGMSKSSGSSLSGGISYGGGSSYGGSSLGGSSYGSGSSMGGGTSGGPKVVQIIGYHYHNPSDPDKADIDGGQAYLRRTLLRNLKTGKVMLPTLEEGDAPAAVEVTMRKLGISYPVLLYAPAASPQLMVNPDVPRDRTTGTLPPGFSVDPGYLNLLRDLVGASGQGSPGGMGGMGGMGGGMGGGLMGGGTAGGGWPVSQYASSELGKKGLLIQGQLPNVPGRGDNAVLIVRRFDFVIQFAWEETPPSKRKEDDSKKDKEGSTAAGTTGATSPPGSTSSAGSTGGTSKSAGK